MNVVILGAGESGVGAALLAKQLRNQVFVSDKGTISEKFEMELKNADIEYESNQHSEDRILSAELIVKSPGIPNEIELIQKVKAKGITVISEIEFASRYTDAKIIGITGSNGKTTTTLLIHHLLKEAGFNVEIGGNVGNSFARLLLKPHADYYVLELSSFQLDDSPTLRPYIAVLLNITPDHLDRYNYQFDKYADAKFRITRNQNQDDYLLINQLDNAIMAGLKRVHTIAKLEKLPADFYDHDFFLLNKAKIEFDTCSLKGPHNRLNMFLAARVANLLGVTPLEIQQSLATFENAPHRLQKVADTDGLVFINDSKATNVDATFYALQSIEKNIIWIAGGTDKGNDYTSIQNIAKGKIDALFCLGIDNEKLIESFKHIIPEIDEFLNMNLAVQRAKEQAKPGTTILLSPACASFDLFKNYIDRGNQFISAVKNLIE